MTIKEQVLSYDPNAVSYRLNDHREDGCHWYVRYLDYRDRETETSGARTAQEAWRNALAEINSHDDD